MLKALRVFRVVLFPFALLALVALTAACSDDSGGSADSAVADARLADGSSGTGDAKGDAPGDGPAADGPAADARTADARRADAGLVDARLADGPRRDRGVMADRGVVRDRGVLPDATSCGAVKALIDAELARINYCSDPQDCTYGYGQCPFGCYVMHNKAESPSAALALMTRYKQGLKCDNCVYRCAAPGTVKCTNKKCEMTFP